MFQHSSRGTAVWLIIVGLALALTLIAGEIPAAAAALLLAAYLALAYVVTRRVEVGSIIESLPRPPARQAQATEVAREASGRASNHPRFDPLVHLLDIGLIVDEQRPDGLSLRRGRFISLDDDGVRPFAIVDVPEGIGDRMARIRFEIRDEDGKPRYVYEDDKWLRAGENALLPDYRLPISGNESQLGAGMWIMRVQVDGGMLGIHNFNLSPSLSERRRQLSPDGELRERVWRSEEEDVALPLSLEELLRQQSQQHRAR
ncbi:hypothetical protein [Aggregatilinea lenta]|uniref:hypothetical protein n=1 Tax=Aggregatilinea lenta TaxID=913108 RepID=UPI000E5BD89B|nr:hypothetical protein [Aggregatilinea lenta]